MDMKKKNGYWTYETCMEESRNYTTRTEFQKGNGSAYDVALKNGWLDKYTWFKRLVKPNGYWNYKTCMEESKKYKSRGEFQKGCSRAYKVALKNGWLDKYTWLKRQYHDKWTYETCMKESKKYNTRNEFCKGSNGAYIAAWKNGWLDKYTWLGESKTSKKWNYKTCMEESKKYKSRNEFCKGSTGAYIAALKNGWLDKYTWLKDERFDLYKDNIDSVYVYEFKEFNCAYVGRTLMRCKRQRDIAHIFHTDNDAVAKFAKEHNISVPEPIYLEENLTLEDGAKQEEYWFNKYKEDGWTMLNSAKTGSIGTLGKGKWNKKTCMEESKKYKSRGEFRKGSSRAYKVARRNGWLDKYTWLGESKTSKKWNYKTCMEESKKYKSRGEFCKGNGSAYNVAWKNGWLDEYTWLISPRKTKGYWNYKTCMEESKKYKSRGEFCKGCVSAYNVARRNGWIDDFFPKCNDLAMTA